MLRRLTHVITTSRSADQMRQLALRLVGLGALVQAGFTIGPTAGWAAAGVSALVLEWSLEDEA